MARIASKEDLQSARDLGAEIQKTLDNSSGFAEKLANQFSKIDGNAQNLANSIDKFSKKQNQANKDNLKGQMALNKASLTFRNITASALAPLEDQFESVKGTYDKYSQMIPVGGKFVGLAAAGAAAFALLAASVAETRKDLGVSAVEAAKINAQIASAGFVARLFGLSSSDIKESFDAISGTLGGIEKATGASALNFARFSLRLGVAPSQAASLLKQLESVSGASRETLMAQLESTNQLIRQQGVAPGKVLQDVADNAEFFAKFAKDGSNNLFLAAANARKLGLNLGAVESISNSLLDFESSINAQLEAQVLLGRNINTDRARQLAFTGDNVGLLEEVKNLVGSEAEFNSLNVIQRQALANAIGLSVGDLSKVVAEEENAVTAAKANFAVFTALGALLVGIAGAVIGALTLGAGIVPSLKGAAIGGAGGLAVGAGLGAAASTQFNDFVQRPGQAPTAFSPADTIIGTKDPSSLSGGNMGETNSLLRELIAGQERMRSELKGGSLET
jgi:hypothetical protein